MMPALIACATLLNLGFSSRFFIEESERVNVIDSQFLTSEETNSGSIADRSSSSLSIRLRKRKYIQNEKII
jgi:hypothetical protein